MYLGKTFIPANVAFLNCVSVLAWTDLKTEAACYICLLATSRVTEYFLTILTEAPGPNYGIRDSSMCVYIFPQESEKKPIYFHDF